MSKVKSVYMMTDLEGFAVWMTGIPAAATIAAQARGVAERAEMQRLLTGEVNAAAEACWQRV